MAETNAKLNVLIALKSAVQGGDAALQWVAKYGAALAATAATMAVFAGKQSLDLGGAITDLANRAQLGTDAFQVLALAALESGVKMEEVSAAAAKLRQNIQTAREGNAAMTASLAQLNLTAAGLQALAPERQWEMIAQRIATATDRQGALNAAADLFGAKNAPKLMETLQRLGVEGYDKLAQGTEKIRLSESQLKTLDDAGDKLGRIVEQLKYIAAKGTVNVIDTVAGEASLIEQSFNDNEIERAKALIEIWEKKGNAAMAATWRANLAQLQAQAAADPYAERNATRQAGAAQASADARQAAYDAAEADAAFEVWLTNYNANLAVARANSWDLADARRKDLALQIQQGAALFLETEERKKKFAIYQAEQSLSRELAASQQAIQKLAADALITRQQRAELETAELRKQNAAIAERIALLEREQLLNPDPSRQGQIDSLRGNAVQNDGRIEELRPRGTGESVGGALVAQMDQVGTAAENAASIVSGTLGSAVSGISSGIQGLINGTMTWADALQNIASTILDSVIGAIADMFAKWIVGRAAAGIAAMAWSAKEGAADTAAKTPGALLTSISSFGVAAAVGLAALVGVMAAAGGFAEGGKVTGPGTATSDSIPAWLSDGEYVLPAGVAASIGYDNLDAIRAGGGIFNSPTVAAAAPTPSAAPAAGGGGNTRVSIANVNTRSELRRFMETAEGRQIIQDASARQL